MVRLNTQIVARGFVYFIGLVIFVVTAYMGCSSGKKLTPEQLAAQAAREKARQDSIAAFELKKNWSFGYTNFQNKEYNRVPQFFWKVIDIDRGKTFKDVYSFLARTYLELQRADSAELVLKMGVKEFPDNAHLHRSLAYLYENSQRNDEAISEYEIIVRIDPKSEEDLKRLTNLYVQANDIDNAMQGYQKLMKLAPDNAQYKNDYAALLQSTGREGEAIQQQLELLKNDPENTELLIQLASYYKKERNYVQAVRFFERYLKINPDDQFAWEDLATQYMFNNQLQKAIGVYNRLLAKKPNDARIMTEQADAYRELGQLRKALQIARKAARIDRSYGKAHLVVGRVYESAVDKCGKAGKYNFDDKLVFEMAYKAWSRAAKDVAVKSQAERLMASLKEVLPTKGDRFMNQGQTKPISECYQWLL